MGTPYYLAPEVLHGDYSKECDCWSLGVIMYVILSSYLPFHGNNQAEVYKKIKSGVFTFDHEEFNAVNDSAKDLITRLLTTDKAQRFTCSQALEHQWFQDVLGCGRFISLQKHGSLGPELATLQALTQYECNSQLKMEALNVLVRMLDET